MLSTSIGISGFFVAYFWVMNHPLNPITVMPLTALDHWVTFRPEALPVYLSLWLYVSLPPALFKTFGELRSYWAGCLALSVLGLSIFMLWPTAVPVFEIDWSLHPSIEFLKTVDVAGNACPSLHVAFAVFSAGWLDRQLRDMNAGLSLRGVNALWSVAIAYSTLATRQHVALDVLAGALLGGVTVLLHLRLARPQRR